MAQTNIKDREVTTPEGEKVTLKGLGSLPEGVKPETILTKVDNPNVPKGFVAVYATITPEGREACESNGVFPFGNISERGNTHFNPVTGVQTFSRNVRAYDKETGTNVTIPSGTAFDPDSPLHRANQSTPQPILMSEREWNAVAEAHQAGSVAKLDGGEKGTEAYVVGTSFERRTVFAKGGEKRNVINLNIAGGALDKETQEKYEGKPLGEALGESYKAASGKGYAYAVEQTKAFSAPEQTASKVFEGVEPIEHEAAADEYDFNLE